MDGDGDGWLGLGLEEGTEACASERAGEVGMRMQMPSVSLDSRERRSPLNEWVGLDEYACGV
jgi:hypothetical protein